jgi:NAD+ synthase
MYPLALNEDALREIRHQLKAFLKNSIRAANARGAVIALSGGVDSSVVAAIAHDAVNTKALILPEKGTTITQDTLDATFIAETYNLPFTIIEISDLINCFRKTAKPILPIGRSDRPSIVDANLKPRIRMILSYVVANADRRLVVGTSNRTELLTGYFTKHGDGAADILPIGDLYKTQVLQLARYLGIPESIISKPPSAGLWPGQTDEEELGIPYPLLDRILYQLVDSRSTVAEVAHSVGVEQRRVQQIDERVASAEHKRRVPLVANIR